MNPRGIPRTFSFNFKHILYGIGALFLLGVLFGSSYTVNQGKFGVVQRFGQVVTVSEPGLHFKLPFIDNLETIPSSLQSTQVNASAVSKDIQEVGTSVNVQFNIPKSVVRSIYANYGTNMEALQNTVVKPSTESVTKAVTAKFTAEQLISLRDQVASQLKTDLSKNLQTNAGLFLAKVEITNFSFSDAFTKSIENKVVASQNVLTAKQNLEQKKIESQQRVAEAEADATAIRVRADAEAYALKKQNESVTPLTVQLRETQAKILIAEAMKEWRPNVIGATPLVNVDGGAK